MCVAGDYGWHDQCTDDPHHKQQPQVSQSNSTCAKLSHSLHMWDLVTRSGWYSNLDKSGNIWCLTGCDCMCRIPIIIAKLGQVDNCCHCCTRSNVFQSEMNSAMFCRHASLVRRHNLPSKSIFKMCMHFWCCAICAMCDHACQHLVWWYEWSYGMHANVSYVKYQSYSIN